jgi:SP family general alpha glucoside:H+ symporter-like MFS transporter
MSGSAEKQGYEANEAGVEAEKMPATIEEIMLKTAYVAEKDKEIGVLEAIRRYPKEIFWSAVFSMGLIMCGYDAQIISSLFGLPSFNQRFGTMQPDGTFSVSAAWQTALTMGTPMDRSLLYFLLTRWNGSEEKRRMPSPSHAVLVLSSCNFLLQAFRCCVLAKLLQAYCGEDVY